MRQADFVHLHLHSVYSILQSTIRLPRLMERARDYRLPALAITDHGNMFGSIEFYELAYAHGVKPILGCELSIGEHDDVAVMEAKDPTPAKHFVLLAKDRRGYENLIKLVTLAHTQGWQAEARITHSQLLEHHHGLVMLSGCARGEIPGWLLVDNYERAREQAGRYLEVFGRERFFIEIQPPLTDSHKRLNEQLLALAREMDLEIVATANSHILDYEEAELLRILAGIRQGATVDEIAVVSTLPFLSPEEVKAEFAHLPEAISTTMAIAERCNLDLELGRIHLPRFPLAEGQEAQEVLTHEAREGLAQRLANRKEADTEYNQRLEHELKTVERLGLSDYFLVVADFVRFAKASGVPVGPGSGAAGASLISYALDITEIDPLQHDLLFEHLVNSQRPEVPDMDLGFGMEMRDEVREYLRRTYGHDRVAHIISIGTMQMRTALKDLGRVLSVPNETVEQAAALAEEGVRTHSKGQTPAGPWSVDTDVQSPEKLLALATALEGLPRHVGTHATGMVISDVPLVQRVPLYCSHKQEWVSQYDMYALKRVGLIKFDLLARKTLTVIRKTLARIGRSSRVSVAPGDLPLDDKPAFDLLCKGQTAGIPYLDTMSARNLLLKWQPSHWHDLLKLMAVNRQAALERGLTERALRTRREGQGKEPLPQPQEKRLGDGVDSLLFDVDLTRLIASTTGWSLEQADVLYRQMVRHEVEQLESLRQEFLEQASAKGQGHEAAEALWSRLERAAGWARSKSETVGQALIVLQAAFLKARFPEQFMASLLSSELHQSDILASHVQACRAEGYRVLPPDINTSAAKFAVEGDGIRFGLAAIRQVSQTTADAIVRVRQEQGPFQTLSDLCASVDRQLLGRRALEALIKAGALDSFKCGRKRLLEMLPDVIEQVRQGQITLFDRYPQEAQPLYGTGDQMDWDEPSKLAHEKEALGFYLSGHPLSEHSYVLEKLSPGGISQIRRLPGGSAARLGGIVQEVRVIRSRKDEPLHIIRIENLEGSLEAVVFADTLASFGKEFEKGALVLVTGRVAREAGQVRLVADRILALEDAAINMASSVHLHLPAEGTSTEKLRKLEQIISAHSGQCRLFLHFHIGQQVEVVQKLSSRHAIRPDRELEEKLGHEFGEHSLEIRYRAL